MEKISVLDRGVYEDLCKSYLNLKLLSRNACTGPACLERCKQEVRNDIHSTRKLCRVHEFDDLVLLLEQMNLLSLLKPDLFERLANTLNSGDVAATLTAYRNLLGAHYAAVRRFHLEDLRHRDRRTLLEKEVEKVKLHETTQGTIPPPVVTRRDKYLQQRGNIYSLLQQEIGKDWKTVGRFLNVPPSALDEIEERNRNDLKMRIFEVIECGEQNFSEATLDRFVGVLVKALESSRRKDLKRKIEKMLL